MRVPKGAVIVVSFGILAFGLTVAVLYHGAGPLRVKLDQDVSSQSVASSKAPIAISPTPPGLVSEMDPLRSFASSVHFYGRVLDLANSPVAGAEIQYQWINDGGVFVATNRTDANGSFEIQKNRVLSLFVN